MTLQSWLQTVLIGLVNHPESITITEKTDEQGILLTISTHKEDLGVVIGRKGEHVNSLRTLLRACGHLQGIKASLKVIDN